MEVLRRPPAVSGVTAREIIDSRGNPTVSVKLWLSDGSCGTANVPSGASTGKYEAYELRDADGSRYNGKGVLRAVNNVNETIAKAITGVNIYSQCRLDEILCGLGGDKDDNKRTMGANAVLAVSVAYLRACAAFYSMPLYHYIGGVYSAGFKMPVPMMNIMNGGAHAKNNMDIQEFMIVPVSAASEAEAVRICCEIYHALGKILSDANKSSGVGDEGGYAPSLEHDEEGIEFIVRAVESAGYRCGDDITIALDAAASEWTDNNSGSGNVYTLPKRGISYDSDGMISYWRGICEKYPVMSIEDALGEDDIDGWIKFTAASGGDIMIVGDDLFTTNMNRISDGIKRGYANSVLIKPNQAGTVTETLSAINTGRRAGYKIVVSHRSGETEDSFIADLAYAVGADFIKTGAPCRGERTSKYNRLTEIERELSGARL